MNRKTWLFRRKLGHCGKNVRIYSKAQIIRPEVVTIGDHSQIDDFAWLLGGQGIHIGRRVHIASHVTVAGGGNLVIGDYASIAAGCRIITGSDDLSGMNFSNPCVPANLRRPERSLVQLGDHSVLATGSIVFPGARLGEGCVVGAGSVVTKSLPPWTVCWGRPAVPVRARSTYVTKLTELFREELE